ncbi:MAG: nucleoside deaminase [Pseudomonadales bacterium]|jgi:tRNA(Arg) A34 adenosine deaminase TadA|nr:nucleoside deaminase [Pseudomonadales bacterium]
MTTEADDALMARALAAADRGAAAGEAPFGCALLLADGARIEAHNRVGATGDPTAHAELEALHRAAEQTAGPDALVDAVAACTGEPCPMCASALLWAGVRRIVWAVSIEELAGLGVAQQRLSSAELFERLGANVALRGGVARDAGRARFARWCDAAG